MLNNFVHTTEFQVMGFVLYNDLIVKKALEFSEVYGSRQRDSDSPQSVHSLLYAVGYFFTLTYFP